MGKQKTVQKVQDLRLAMKSALLERDNVVDGMLVALISREMMFLLGTPGTAKSLACEILCNAIGGNYFSWLMSKFSTPEEIFGPYSLKALGEDKYVRVTTGKLPEADLAFLDEFWKGSSAILNTMLPVINERVYHSGSGPQKVPLQTCFVASNEIPSSEELSAMYDRFALRFVVEQLKDEDNFRKLLEGNFRKVQIPKISKAELAEAQADAAQLQMASDAIEKMIELRRAVNEKGIYISDRKWTQAVNVIKAFAYLEGHASVEVEDLVILENVLWHSPEQIPEIRTLVRKLCNPVAEIVQRNIDAAQDVMSQYKKGKIPGMEAFQKLQLSKAELEKLHAQNPREFVKKAADDLGSMSRTLADSLFKAKVK